MVRATAPKRILVVDSNESIRRMIRFFLESECLTICGEAVNGCEAIEKAQELEPDLIVLDISLPGMNGLRTASGLKQMCPHTPIVLFTLFPDVFREFEAPTRIDSAVAKGDISLLINGVHGLLQSHSGSASPPVAHPAL